MVVERVKKRVEKVGSKNSLPQTLPALCLLAITIGILVGGSVTCYINLTELTLREGGKMWLTAASY